MPSEEVTIPSATAPDAYQFAQYMHDLLLEANYYVPTEAVLKIMEIVTLLRDGPRYEAHALTYKDSLGNPSYSLIDTRTGAVVMTYDGYFAGQDARAAAIQRNEQEK